MCGICGIFNYGNKREVQEIIVRNMCRVMKHRGPDDEGVYVNEFIGLGMRRLSIIDLVSGYQPIHNEDKTIWIVFNGEIYNYLNLRKNLLEKGHVFYTHSDTEVIIHLYEEYGEKCVEQLRGMFAFAIWNENERKLILARDRLGQKPLHYYYDGEKFLFASEIKSILAYDTIKREMDFEAFDEYFTFGFISAPRSIYKNIRKVVPGNLLIFQNGRINQYPYWRLSFENNISHLEEEEIVAQLLAILEESVKIRMIADVPIGALLSGGIDSSTIVAMMTRNSSKPIKTFSIGFSEEDFDETHYARIVAQRFGTDHYECIVKPDFMSIIDEIVWQFDEPFGDDSALPTYYVSKITREKVTVALSGDGGDEVFGGYPMYLRAIADLEYDKYPSPIKKIAKLMAYAYPRFLPKGRQLHKLASCDTDRFIERCFVFDPNSKNALYSKQVKAELQKTDASEFKRHFFKDVHNQDFVTQRQYNDLMHYLPDDILAKVDRMSMLNSLETRSPFLDHKLIEFTASIPSNLKIHNGNTKYILKKSLEGILPKEILTRGKKGFGVPIKYWFSNELYPYCHEILSSQIFRKRGFFNQAAIEFLLKRQKNSGRGSRKLWLLICFELWCRAGKF